MKKQIVLSLCLLQGIQLVGMMDGELEPRIKLPEDHMQAPKEEKSPSWMDQLHDHLNTLKQKATNLLSRPTEVPSKGSDAQSSTSRVQSNQESDSVFTKVKQKAQSAYESVFKPRETIEKSESSVTQKKQALPEEKTMLMPARDDQSAQAFKQRAAVQERLKAVNGSLRDLDDKLKTLGDNMPAVFKQEITVDDWRTGTASESGEKVEAKNISKKITLMQALRRQASLMSEIALRPDTFYGTGPEKIDQAQKVLASIKDKLAGDPVSNYVELMRTEVDKISSMFTEQKAQLEALSQKSKEATAKAQALR